MEGNSLASTTFPFGSSLAAGNGFGYTPWVPLFVDTTRRNATKDVYPLSKGANMVREIKARFSKGKLELLESLDLEEGDEVVVAIQNVSSRKRLKGLRTYAARKAKQAGITSENQVNDLIHEQRLRNA